MPPQPIAEPGVLRQRLRQLREDAGLTGIQLAERLGEGWSSPKISKIEHGRQTHVLRTEVRAWAKAVGAIDQLPELLDLLENEQASDRRWAQTMREGAAPVQQDLDVRAREATRIRDVGILLVPGLLQTPPYIRCIIEQAASTTGATDIDATVIARIRRTEVLHEPGRTFEFIIAEAALRTWVCPRDVMAGQLYQLMTATQLPNVTLGIIPMGRELRFTPLQPFMMLDGTAIVETYGTEHTAGEDESRVYDEVFGRLMADAATGDEARTLIANAAAALR